MKQAALTLLLLIGLCSVLAARDFSQPFKAGCAQIFITADVRANTDKVIAYINQADSLGLDIVLFPETALSGYFPMHFPEGGYPAGALLDSALVAVQTAARAAGIWVVVGTSTLEEGSYYNMVYTIDDLGKSAPATARSTARAARTTPAGWSLNLSRTRVCATAFRSVTTPGSRRPGVSWPWRARAWCSMCPTPRRGRLENPGLGGPPAQPRRGEQLLGGKLQLRRADTGGQELYR